MLCPRIMGIYPEEGKIQCKSIQTSCKSFWLQNHCKLQHIHMPSTPVKSVNRLIQPMKMLVHILTLNCILNRLDGRFVSKSWASFLETLDGIVHIRCLRQLDGILLTILMAWLGRFSGWSGRGLTCANMDRAMNTILSQCSCVSVLLGSGRFIVMLNIVFRISAETRTSSCVIV